LGERQWSCVGGTGNGNGNGYGNGLGMAGSSQVRPEFVGSGAFDSTRPRTRPCEETDSLCWAVTVLLSHFWEPMSSSTTFIPTTRSRTLLFISYRDSSARAPPTSRSSGRQYQDAYHTNDENEGLIDHQGTPHISLDVELPPKWFVRSECHISRIFPIRWPQKIGSTT
jgi:hypothetical protein